MIDFLTNLLKANKAGLIILVINIILGIMSFLFLWRNDPKKNDKHKVRGGTFREEKEDRYYPDWAFLISWIYSLLCFTLFLYNVVYLRIVEFDNEKSLSLLHNEADFFYFMGGLGFAIIFFVLPERTQKLEPIKLYYLVITGIWLLLALISDTQLFLELWKRLS
jgi:Na+/melibiose symporter-like transporter